MNREKEQTPLSDRGVENTSELPVEVLVDWLSSSFVFEKNPEKIMEYLGIEKDYFLPSNKRFSSYDMCFATADESISIYYCSEYSPNQYGCFLNMSGTGCRLFERLTTYKEHNWKALFSILYGIGSHFTRLDVAIDDYKNTYTIKMLQNKVDNGECVSRFRLNRDFKTKVLSTGEVLGHTLYFGSDQSELQIRFYDKKQERIDKKAVFSKPVDTWVRCEMQLRRDRATDFIEKYLFSGLEFGDLSCSVLKHYISFRVKNKKESNRSRWNLAPFWKKFLDKVEPLPLVSKARETDLIQTFNWLNKSIPKSLYMYLITQDDGIMLLEEMLLQAKQDLKDEDILRLEDYTKQVHNLTFSDFMNRQKNNLSEENTPNRSLNYNKLID